MNEIERFVKKRLGTYSELDTYSIKDKFKALGAKIKSLVFSKNTVILLLIVLVSLLIMKINDLLKWHDENQSELIKLRGDNNILQNMLNDLKVQSNNSEMINKSAIIKYENELGRSKDTIQNLSYKCELMDKELDKLRDKSFKDDIIIDSCKKMTLLIKDLATLAKNPDSDINKSMLSRRMENFVLTTPDSVYEDLGYGNSIEFIKDLNTPLDRLLQLRNKV